MLDFEELDIGTQADRGVKMHVLHPITRVETKASLTILGTDSKVFRDSLREQSRDTIARAKLQAKGDAIEEPTLEQIEADTITKLAKCVVSWDGVAEGGKLLPFSFDNVVYMLTKYRWLREQVDVFMGTRANFLPVSKGAGKPTSDSLPGSTPPRGKGRSRGATTQS